MDTVIIIVVSIVGTFVFLLVAVALLWWWIKRKVKGFVGDLLSLAADHSALAPPLVIELEADEDPDWSQGEAIATERDALLAAGYTEAGAYTIDAIGGVTVLGLVNETDRTMAAIYEHGTVGVWCDVTQVDESGTVYGVTSGPEPNLAQAPWKSGSHHPGTPASELLQHFKDGQPSTPRAPVQPTDFKEVFEREYEREMQWHVDRGGPSEEEIRRIAAKSGQDVDDDTIEQIRELWRENINDKLEADLRKAFLAANQVSAAEWDEIQHRTVFIHDGVTASQIVEHYMSFAADDDSDYNEKEAAAEDAITGKKARDAFNLLNFYLPEDRRYRLLATLEAPVAADIYVCPESEYD